MSASGFMIKQKSIFALFQRNHILQLTKKNIKALPKIKFSEQPYSRSTYNYL